MKASYNYTGRKRLDNSTFEIEVHEVKDGPSTVEVTLHRNAVEGIADSAVPWVEAYAGPRAMRFRMKRPDEASITDRFLLDGFGIGEPVLFRIKIVDESDQKRPIRARRDRIRPTMYSTDGSKKKSVLPVFPCDLGHIAWQLDWTDSSRPVLQVNSRISEVRDITSIAKNDPDFAILVFPQVIRDVLTRLLDAGVDDDEDSRENEWLLFGAGLAGRPFVGSEDDEEEDSRLRNDWVSDVVQSFGRGAELVSRYNRFKRGDL